MCARHWRICGPEIQAAIWRTYRRGQEIDKSPSQSYMLAQRAAVWTVFVAEGGCSWPDVPEIGTEAFMIGPAVIGRSSPAQCQT